MALDGPLELELGRETALHVGGVRILNPPGFATPELATLGKARLRIDLLELLRGRLQVEPSRPSTVACALSVRRTDA